MLGFNHAKFKEAIRRVEEERHTELVNEVNQVRDFIEKALSLALESSAHKTNVNYPGLEM